MRILFIYDFPLWGSGSGTWLRYLVEELVKMNHKVGIIAPEERRFLEDKIKQYRVTPPQIPVFVGHPELKGAKRYSELSEREITEVYKAYLDTTIEAVANFKPDIIHVHHLFLIAWIARYIYALLGVKYLIISHGSDLYALLSDKRYLRLSKDAVNSARAIVANSGWTRREFLKLFGKEHASKVRIIPGGIDIKQYPQNLDTKAVDEKYSLDGKKVVLFAGRLISHKGVRYLVRAAKDIKAEVFIVGDGPERQYLQTLISRRKLQNVHLIGYLTGQELIELYYRADVFVAPSVWEEPMGFTILEAMASKTPVIATRKGGIPMLVKHGYNGLFVKVRNSREIASACNKLLEDDELRRKLGENARKTVEEKFTWKQIAQKFNRLYKKLANKNK
jgi:glycosyltransferase involved in cell wall biosynthesis